MNRNTKRLVVFLLVIFAVVLLIGSALGGALADRLFVIKPLDYLAPRNNATSGPVIGQKQIVNEDSVVVDVADTSSKSVVTVSITSQQQPVPQFFMDPFGNFNIPGDQQPQTVKQDIGSGFVVDKAGLIVTNKHVVEDTTATYKVIANDNKEYDVQKIYRDPANDLAILKVNATDLTPITLGNSDNLKVGQMVIAIGTALGQFRHTVTTGVISGLGRGIQAGSGFGGFAEQLDNVIQTDAAINPGNSGGPLLNSSGQVIGVNVAVAAAAQNIGFALPINVLKQSLDTFNKTGQFSRPFMGVSYRMIPKETALLNDVPQGAYIVSVVANSSAATAGLQQGDIITKLDGQAVADSTNGLADIINKHKVGDTIVIEFWRDKTTKTTNVTLKEAQ
ncbi:MAG TPA: trypsin-like peptidase domain-containing protein [Candidatus Saccharimonadia bacterium]|nr:trypsin-like peptidase domain-containing protein [Candidatus Saccharimonadia bacterium]